MLKLINKGQITDRRITSGTVTHGSCFPVFATPDDICERPFLFSRQIQLRLSSFSIMNKEVIDCAVETKNPLDDPLLTSFGDKSAFGRYCEWWTEWHNQQEDSLYLGMETQDIKLVLYHLEGVLGRRFIEPDYPAAQ